MNGRPAFDPVADAPLLSAYVDGELDGADLARVEAHLATSAEARREVERLRTFKQVTDGLRLREAPPEDWESFWNNAYNRSERSLGWVLLVAGLVVGGSWALLQTGRAIFAAELPLLVKGGLLAGALGVTVLLVSVLRERLFTRKRTRYDDIVR
ncbi:MAG: zf-HC2 domain-containing protein [bacterium]|jgi:anti-sigma factor RsiW|nr:zf-HC2 domain-containing protein [bacterium]MBK7187306.1 zf-HC2 domain-containing protein [bacterium]MBK9776865.1 zf-HC2 domain-containing protein [bacterium]